MYGPVAIGPAEVVVVEELVEELVEAVVETVPTAVVIVVEELVDEIGKDAFIWYISSLEAPRIKLVLGNAARDRGNLPPQYSF